jgi:hypothetical protein
VKSDALLDQLITFTRYCRETPPIQYRDLLSAALNQTRAFQLSGGIRDGWPLNTQHLGQQVLGATPPTYRVSSSSSGEGRQSEVASHSMFFVQHCYALTRRSRPAFLSASVSLRTGRVCTENHIRVYQVTESAKLAQW